MSIKLQERNLRNYSCQLVVEIYSLKLRLCFIQDKDMIGYIGQIIGTSKTIDYLWNGMNKKTRV